jgi:DNA modification methylase
MGSGTTAKCSIQLKRNWIGSEIDNNYFELINKRMLNVSDEMIDTFITRNDINKNK